MREKKAKKLLEQVKLTYNQIAEEFSETRKLPWDDFQHFEAYLKPKSEIVDLGCGNGRLLKFLAKVSEKWDHPSYRYLGIDNSEKLIEQAKKENPYQHFILGDQLQIPVGDNTTDVLFSIAAFHHIPSKKLQIKALQEMHRILKKDGLLMMTVWNLWQKHYWKHVFYGFVQTILTFGNLRPNDLFIPWGKNKIPRYYYAFRSHEIRKLIEKNGFEIIELFFVKKGEKVPVSKSHNICIIARKK